MTSSRAFKSKFRRLVVGLQKCQVHCSGNTIILVSKYLVYLNLICSFSFYFVALNCKRTLSSMELWFHDCCKLIQVPAVAGRIRPSLPLPPLHPYLVLALVLMGHDQVNWEQIRLKTYPAKKKWCLNDLGKLLCVFSKQEECPAAAFPELLIGFLFVTLRLLVLIKAFGLCKSAIWSTVASLRSFFLESKFFSPTLLKLHCPCFSGCLTSYPFHVAHRRLIQSPLKVITGFMLLIADFGSEIN